MPIGIEKQTLVYGQTYTLKGGGGSGYCGNLGGLTLGGNGASIFSDNLKYGYSGLISVGDWVPTKTGNMVGPTDSGIGYRIGLDPNATFNTVQPGSARIVIIPIIDSFAVNGKKPVLIDGFAVFFLEGSSSGVVTGKFMQMTSSSIIPGNGKNYGLSSIKLTQ